MISEAILIPKIYARLQEIASNFSKFAGGGPPDPPPALVLSALGSGLRPFTGPPFPKFLEIDFNHVLIVRVFLFQGSIKCMRCGLLRSIMLYRGRLSVCQSVCHASDCSYSFARCHHINELTCISYDFYICSFTHTKV